MAVGSKGALGLLVVLLAAAVAGSALAGKGGKPDVSKVKVGKGPIDVAVGDFDRDGRKDVAVTNFQDFDPFTISILRGRPKGRFKVARTIAIEPQPHGIEVARLGKGKDQDLVVGTFGDEVLLLKGKKGVGFRPPKALAVGQLARHVATGDFNQDGLTDIAAVRQDGDDIAVMLGQGGLGFSAPTFYPVGGNGGGQIVAANVDPGGDLDLLTTEFDNDVVQLFRGQAGGGFVLTDSLVPPSEPTSIAVADLNRDGRRDVVVGLVGEKARVAVFRGLAGGAFAAPKTLKLAGRPMLVRDIAVTKLDRDRDRDLVLVGMEVGGIRAARGFGSPDPLPPSRVLFVEGRGGIGLKRVREVKLTGGTDAVAAARLDRTKPADAVVTRDRGEKRGHAVVILNP